MMQRILLVYFSGTGGTARIADAFEAELIKRGHQFDKINLDRSKQKQNVHFDELSKTTELLILLYPVYAADTPPIIYDWIAGVQGSNMKTAVISVSGGGELWPNTGCRNNCCKVLQKHGFNVIYEKMMVMPANCITPMNDQLAMLVIKVVPEKVSRILDNLLEGKVRRTRFTFGPVKRYLAKSAKLNYHKFAEELEITNDCSGCGLCSRNCPVGNISIADNRPSYGSSCIMCLRCIYDCPEKAIKTKVRMVFKTGFSLTKIEKEMSGIELEPAEKLAKGIVWLGVKKYLLDIDGY